MEPVLRGTWAALPLAIAIAAIAAGTAPRPAHAQADADREVRNPPLLELRRGVPQPVLVQERAAGQAGGRTRALRLEQFSNVLNDATLSPSHEVSLDLNVVYTDGTLWNPATRRNDKVRLRSYQGAHVRPGAPFVSPMLEVRPGDTIRMRLNNRLPPDPGCIEAPQGANTPHCFNGTNLHTHGLWVNPAGNGDNVLISVNPGVSFEYEYNIPSDHPAGTYWYHTHRHGSTALQVASGMAGALVIRGNRPPTPEKNGDLDTLLRPTPRQAFQERVLVFQQIQYACRDKDNHIKLNPDGSYRCDPGDTGGIEHYAPAGPGDVGQFGPGTWAKSGRYTSINGEVLPTFRNVRAGQIERWRAIHGGVRDTINLQFRKMRSGAPAAEGLDPAQQDAYIARNCTGAPLPQHLVAADGLTTAAAMRSNQTIYQPGYRWDTLMVFPEPGDYCVINAAAPASANVGQRAPSRQLLATVRGVAPGGPAPADISTYLAEELAAAAAANMPADVGPQVAADLRDGLKLTRFVPHPTIEEGEVTGTQVLAFNIDLGQKPIQFQVNGRPFEPGRVDRVLTLGGVDEWTLQSDLASHPFHIHVNPFQVVRILDPDGKDVSLPGATDIDPSDQTADPQYPGLKGVWKDTLWVKNSKNDQNLDGKYTLIVRTRYQRYIGDYVLHCHILDHEDQGMMQLVRVALPDGAGGTVSGHHH
ncbi:multicopper oxidase domain-containing protein [Acidovorax sp. NCPPB 3859]|nr:MULTISPECIES: multicopper oxidase domain-containing protein [unclassified Acidovorax]MDA8450804.1 multicopper oxidase domain-containing protein [Acidovorax sp. GBBC 3297]MDA8460111.1 multicopper oxidase domain-containing protein [Acidovorax sp. GBBC 3333]MDA8465285.1 multicopper oxidase domain-containing protein [Acidovorax sp. GBBC 3332]MDA8470181.1 multicopper oxidase domain-containing protein [Acidovorax sp. GBBC 3299]WCM80848.1 multicopper oxidase domain-containing protein [Acidovorax s